jgi:hypothetical protein
MQMANHNDGEEDASLQAPFKLLAELGRLPQERLFVPPTIDEAVLREARRYLGKPERPRFSWWRWIPRFAAAAALVALLTYGFVRHGSRSRPPVFAREDLNHDGRVDILDAFALARQLKAGPAPGPARDINGDGVVDERDVETIAARAVRLDKGSHS